MKMNRREFVLTTTAAAVATSLPVSLAISHSREETTWIHGDPYAATVMEGGLGGRDFASSRDAALRFRTSGEERDRYVLGWDSQHA